MGATNTDQFCGVPPDDQTAVSQRSVDAWGDQKLHDEKFRKVSTFELIPAWLGSASDYLIDATRGVKTQRK